MVVFRHVRLLPLLVIVAVLSLAVRFDAFVGKMAFAEQAAQSTEAPSADAHRAPAPPADAHAQETPPGETHPPVLPADTKEGEKVEWRDSGETAIEFSEAREDLYKDLSVRRAEIEKMEKELSLREALLKAGERELEQKLRELTDIRNEIQGLLSRQSDEEQTRIAGLVKIYEGMKAKDAARIFNTLDMDVLIQVISRMSERKSGAILAEMNPDRARTVTILLAQQQQLPGALLP